MPVSGDKTCFQAVKIVLSILRSLKPIDFQCCCIQENSGVIKHAESMDRSFALRRPAGQACERASSAIEVCNCPDLYSVHSQSLEKKKKSVLKYVKSQTLSSCAAGRKKSGFQHSQSFFLRISKSTKHSGRTLRISV